MGRHASDEVSRVVEALISELETEQFDEPDDEHTQVAVAREGCCVTVYVSGLVELAELLDDDAIGQAVAHVQHMRELVHHHVVAPVG